MPGSIGGLYGTHNVRPHWSIDDVADQIHAIRDTGKLWMLPPCPSGYLEHLQRSFDMARQGVGAA